MREDKSSQNRTGLPPRFHFLRTSRRLLPARTATHPRRRGPYRSRASHSPRFLLLETTSSRKSCRAGSRVLCIQKFRGDASAKTNIIPAFSSRCLRNIRPCCRCSKLFATSTATVARVFPSGATIATHGPRAHPSNASATINSASVLKRVRRCGCNLSSGPRGPRVARRCALGNKISSLPARSPRAPVPTSPERTT